MVPDVGAYRMLTYIGMLYLGKVAVSLSWQAFQGFRAHILSKVCPRVDFLDKYGKWAVVTGCTSGIGRAYTIELARRGLNIVLISRNLDKLHALAIEIESDYSVETKVVQADFSDGRNIYQRIANELSSVDVGILVNNVGVISEHPLYLSELRESDIWQTININIGATTMMTRIVLPTMLRRRCGAIVNISSMAGIRPVPLLSVYSGSKKFVLVAMQRISQSAGGSTRYREIHCIAANTNFHEKKEETGTNSSSVWLYRADVTHAYCSFLSAALCEECRGSGVTVQTLEPSWINTGMVQYSNMLRNGSRWIIPTPEQYVRNAIATLGLVEHTSGYWAHGFIEWMMDSTPVWLWLRVSHYLHRGFRLEGQALSRSTLKAVKQK